MPDLAQQLRIVELLAAYDDLIDNNRRRIKLLEDSVRLLFDEWFVRLRFPGHGRSEVVDAVPSGWGRSNLGQVVRSLEDGDWIESKDQGGEDFRILQISNVGLTTSGRRAICGSSPRRRSGGYGVGRSHRACC